MLAALSQATAKTFSFIFHSSLAYGHLCETHVSHEFGELHFPIFQRSVRKWNVTVIYACNVLLVCADVRGHGNIFNCGKGSKNLFLHQIKAD